MRPDLAVNAALLNFHRATDSRAAAMRAWQAHDAQRAASLTRVRTLQQPASAPGAHVGDAAVAAHASLWNGIKEDFHWTTAIFNFNQLPSTRTLRASSLSLWSRTRASTVGMLVGFFGKVVSFALMVALLPTLGLARRTFDWLFSYAKAGVPAAPAQGADTANAERRQALDAWVREGQMAMQEPHDGQFPPQLSESTLRERSRAVVSLAEQPELNFTGITLASLLQEGEPLGVLLPALSRHLSATRLHDLLAPETTQLRIGTKALTLAPRFSASQPFGPWLIELNEVESAPHHGENTPSMEARCVATLPASSMASRVFGGGSLQTPLRTPVKLTAHLRFTAIGDTVDADVEALGLRVAHEPEHPLWFPARPNALV